MNLKNVLQDCGFEFKKGLGQNFITDTNLLNSICEKAEITKDDEVLEIGVGAGTLTKAIADKAKKVVCYEIDKSLFDILNITLRDYDNVFINFKDFLKANAEEVNSQFSTKYKVVANLPYYVTTNIILELIKKEYNVDSLTLMVQKEVADRLSSKCGTKDYGTLTVELDSIGNVETKMIVKRDMFYPVPNVDSAVVNIKIDRNKYDIKDLDFHTKVVRASFSMRRKTLINCLKNNFDIKIEDLLAIFEELGFDKNIRGEAISTNEFVELSNKIYDFLHKND